ncbi:MAG: ribosomal RNA small subunit methyltransferase A [Myxococcales bacterium]|nr:ribosomal RNA small subunit methyltransferase A [Myxococcales bacterium]
MSDRTDPRKVLPELQRRAAKRFGQHFLARPSVCTRMVRVAKVAPGDRVLEIGPGLGVLTEQLLEAGAEVTALEVDDDLAGHIGRTFPAVRLLHTDATRVDWAEVLPGEGWKVVANLPYNVGTGLVMDLARQHGRVASLTVMLQAEVVERLVAEAGSRTYGAVTVELAAHAEARAVFAIPPDAFVPPPKVRSLVARIDVLPAPRTGAVAPGWLDRVVRAGFAQRRKTLKNALTAVFGADRATSALQKSGIDGGLRAERLDLSSWVALSEALHGPT